MAGGSRNSSGGGGSSWNIFGGGRRTSSYECSSTLSLVGGGLSFLGTILDNFWRSCSLDSFAFLRCSELDVSPLLTQPEHSDVRLLELELVVGLLGLLDGGLSGFGMTGRLLLRLSLLSRIGMQGNETALRGTTTLFCATGTLAHLSLFTLGAGAPALDVSEGVVPFVAGVSMGDLMGSTCDNDQDTSIKNKFRVVLIL